MVGFDFAERLYTVDGKYDKFPPPERDASFSVRQWGGAVMTFSMPGLKLCILMANLDAVAARIERFDFSPAPFVVDDTGMAVLYLASPCGLAIEVWPQAQA